MQSPLAELNVSESQNLRARLDATPKIDLVTNLRAAILMCRGCGWFRSLIHATFGPGRLDPHEFFYYQLYDPSLSNDDIARYVGVHAQTRMHDVCNEVAWYGVCQDKLVFYSIMRAVGIAVPETFAVYDRRGRSAFCTALRTISDLHDFITDDANYPMFAKPADGMYSVGALRLETVEDGHSKLAGGKRASIDDIVQFVSSFSSNGYLFQKVIVPHPAFSEAFGHTVATVRLFILWQEQGPVVESAVIKIPVSTNVADNFWRTGNMLGAVDHGTGKIRRVISGVGAGTSTKEHHPETGVPLLGMELPFWREVVATGLKGAANFPGLRTQSWDISVTPEGPVAVEANPGGDLNLHQLAHRRGSLTPSYVDHLKRCGYKKRLP